MTSTEPGPIRGRHHPLDPLDPAELTEAVRLVREQCELAPSDLFVSVSLAEPAKAAVTGSDDHRDIERRAKVLLWRQRSRELVEGLVSLDLRRVVTWTVVEGASSPMIAAQVQAALEVAMNDPTYMAGLRERGLRESSSVHLEAWPFGGLLPDRFSGRRVIYTPAWERRTPDDNPYAHPIHGYYAIIDLDTLELLEIEDHEPRPIPERAGKYRSGAIETAREMPRLEVVQPDGPGFDLDGHAVSWQNWRLRVGFCPREGLVIHDVRYVDAGRERRIAHRLSMAELVIPYADPSPGSYRKNAFDTGEVFIGNYTNSLTLGCDCLGSIVYLDASIVDAAGDVRTIENAICLHEEDSGILWKHTDSDGHVEVRRGRRFVVSSIYTVDNYEYGYYWYFGMDGSIEFEAKFTGIVLTLAGQPGAQAPFATEVAPGLLAPHHQHVFCARLDLDIDGSENTVTEVDAVSPSTESMNPYGGSFIEEAQVISSESEAARWVDTSRARYWKISNDGSRNGMGKPVAFKLQARNPVTPMAKPSSSIGRRAGFMYADLWVTAHDDTQRYPAGDYPFQHEGGLGLPSWIRADSRLENADIVLWHVFGITHVPRPEDWPIMPVDRGGFVLSPLGFFDQNPTLDVPAPNACHTGATCTSDDHHADACHETA